MTYIIEFVFSLIASVVLNLLVENNRWKIVVPIAASVLLAFFLTPRMPDTLPPPLIMLFAVFLAAIVGLLWHGMSEE